ncbi:MAG TPA: hypothetical protein VJ943_13490 [Desulfotignum sp.]|nr:hypothetical protein [Desulfotignum sp.]
MKTAAKTIFSKNTTGLLSVVCLALLGIIFFSPFPCNARVEAEWGGHLKTRGSVSWQDDASIYGLADTGEYVDGSAELRLKNKLFFSGRLSMETHYEALITGGDTRRKTADIQNRLPQIAGVMPGMNGLSDDWRFLDLTGVIDKNDSSLAYHRLDRLRLTYLPEWGSISLGRQALTWGNGLLFNPMDLFNPFAPTDIERDYKVGDDMAVVQMYLDHIGDLQFLYVPRRDPVTADPAWDQASLAGKLHVMKNNLELDIMAAKHYADYTLGLGVSGYLKSAAWRMDAVYTFLSANENKNGFLTCTANMDYSWVWATKNMYGLVELYYNSLGEDDSASALANSAIVERLGRGELFTLGRYYLATQIQAELHPLFNVFVTAITNLEDRSVIFQPRAAWNLAQNMELIFGAQMYAGETGSEFGGFTIPGTDFTHKSPDSVFAWVTWYF